MQAFKLRHILEKLPRFENSFTVFTLIPSLNQATLNPSDLDLNVIMTMDAISIISKICYYSSIDVNKKFLLSALENVSIDYFRFMFNLNHIFMLRLDFSPKLYMQKFQWTNWLRFFHINNNVLLVLNDYLFVVENIWRTHWEYSLWCQPSAYKLYH